MDHTEIIIKRRQHQWVVTCKEQVCEHHKDYQELLTIKNQIPEFPVVEFLLYSFILN